MRAFALHKFRFYYHNINKNKETIVHVHRYWLAVCINGCMSVAMFVPFPPVAACGARYKTRPGLQYHYNHFHNGMIEEDMAPSPKPPSRSSSRSGLYLLVRYRHCTVLSSASWRWPRTVLVWVASHHVAFVIVCISVESTNYALAHFDSRLCGLEMILSKTSFTLVIDS